MRNNFFYRIAIASVLIIVTATVAAQSKTVVKAIIDKPKILIGEPLRLTLEADIPEHEPIRFFQFDSIPHFEFLDRPKIDTSNTGGGTMLRQVIMLTSFDSGHWVIPALSLTDAIRTDSIPVDVVFSSFDPAQPYHDVKDIIEVNPQEEKKEIKWWYFVAGAVVLLLLLILLFRKKKKPVVVVVAEPADPYKEAMLELQQLQTEKPETKQYYSRLVDIFRVYVAAKKGIHSLQATTDDLVIQLKGLNLRNDEFDRLSQTLRQSDFVKYAKYIPSAEDDKNNFENVSRSIQLIEQMQ